MTTRIATVPNITPATMVSMMTARIGTDSRKPYITGAGFQTGSGAAQSLTLTYNCDYEDRSYKGNSPSEQELENLLKRSSYGRTDDQCRRDDVQQYGQSHYRSYYS